MARSAALAKRLLTSSRLLRNAERSAAVVREYSLDFERERYVLYVPPERPPDGYSLLVFIEPWDEAGVPREWIDALNRHGVIFVTAAKSGNTQGVYERRIPLALMAAHNVLKRCPVQPEQVYIGGLSGGSRVRAAYGARLPRCRSRSASAFIQRSHWHRRGAAAGPGFVQAQESTRLVYLTGQDHGEHRAAAAWLKAIAAQFGGLEASGSIELAERMHLLD